MYCKTHKESFGAFHSECASCQIADLKEKNQLVTDQLCKVNDKLIIEVAAKQKAETVVEVFVEMIENDDYDKEDMLDYYQSLCQDSLTNQEVA